MSTTRAKYRVMIVDDHPLMRRGYAELISDEPALELCGEASTCAAANQLARQLKPDLIVVDISLPDSSGLELIKQIVASRLESRILVCSIHDESIYAERCLRAGAMGYINKTEPPEAVVEAMMSVLGGEVYLSPRMTRQLLKHVVRGDKGEEVTSIELLTDRELEVFDLIGRGLTTREIANRLHLSIKTVETYRDNIKGKLGLANSAELVRHAVQWVLESD
jgi:DNA-binding NarL/FixJ family response regulator